MKTERIWCWFLAISCILSFCVPQSRAQINPWGSLPTLLDSWSFNDSTNWTDDYGNKQTQMANGSKSKNNIEKKAWTDCEAAAKKAENSHLAKGIDHFTLRQGPIIPGQHDPEKPGFTPDWASGMKHYQEGPFVNIGGGDVPKGPDTYVDFWQTPQPPAAK